MRFNTMKSEFICKYNSSDEDEKMDILMNVTEQIDNNVYKFLLNELDDEIDEFVLVEIIKVLSLYSPIEYNNDLVKKFFQIIEDSDDELVQSYAMQGLEHLKLSDVDYKKIGEIIDKTDNEELVASGRMIIYRK